MVSAHNLSFRPVPAVEAAQSVDPENTSMPNKFPFATVFALELLITGAILLTFAFN